MSIEIDTSPRETQPLNIPKRVVTFVVGAALATTAGVLMSHHQVSPENRVASVTFANKDLALDNQDIALGAIGVVGLLTSAVAAASLSIEAKED